MRRQIFYEVITLDTAVIDHSHVYDISAVDFYHSTRVSDIEDIHDTHQENRETLKTKSCGNLVSMLDFTATYFKIPTLKTDDDANAMFQSYPCSTSKYSKMKPA